MVSINQILGSAASNDSVTQIFTWGVLYGLIGAVFEPVTSEVTQEIWASAVSDGLNNVLPPDLLAVMTVRGWIDEPTAAGQAARSGVNAGDFGRMVNNARNPIAPEEAAVALRRKIIPQSGAPGVPSFDTAIQEGNLGNQWGPVIQQLATQIPTPADVLRGVLQGQVPAGTDPRSLYQQVGGELTDPNTGFDWYTFLFNTEGSAPTPMEAIEMARRLIIPWDGEGPGVVSFHQAFLEGPWRNKWEPAFRGLSNYVPPPRTVTALLRQGAITPAQAQQYFQFSGLSPELATIYTTAATTVKTAAAKRLSESNILTLLNDKLITTAEAVTFLEELGYPANEANILATTGQAAATIADLKRNVNRVGTYYVAHKIDRANALTMLGSLGLDPTAAAAQVDGWDIDRAANVRVLTPAQIESAWEFQLLTQAEAQAELEILGYTPLDAWTVLSIKAKQALPGKPAGGPGLVQ
jgi:hypothetical protein